MPQQQDAALPEAGDHHLFAKGEELVLPLRVEEVSVSRRRVETAVVRVATVTRSREQLVDKQLTHERVEITRISVGCFVDAVPAVREDGDLTIIPVVEEVVVVERRLLLKEEVHLRRVRTTEQHVEAVRLREQEAVITRIPAGDQGAAATPPD